MENFKKGIKYLSHEELVKLINSLGIVRSQLLKSQLRDREDIKERALASQEYRDAVHMENNANIKPMYEKMHNLVGALLECPYCLYSRDDLQNIYNKMRINFKKQSNNYNSKTRKRNICFWRE